MERVASSKPVCVPRSKLARHSSFDTAEACADWSSESSATQLEACSSRTACDGGARAHAGRAAGVGRRACSVAFRRARRKRRRQLARHGGRDESDFFGAGAGHRRDHGVFWRSAVWLDSHPHNLFRRRRDPARGAQRRKPCAVHARNGLRSARHHVLDGRGHQVGPSGVFDALRHRRAGRARPDLRLGHQHALAAAHCAFVGDLAGDRWYCDGAAVLDGATHDRRGKVPSASDAAAASDRVWLHDVCALALRDRKLNMSSGQISRETSLLVAAAVAMAGAGFSRAAAAGIRSRATLARRLEREQSMSIEERQQAEVQGIFRMLQVVTACLLSFSHGSNDVSNAIGPFSAMFAAYAGKTVITATPVWVLLLGGVGISFGLWFWGRPVMETVGTKITPLVPTKGFCAELATATTVLVASELGLPVSTTHTLIGCIVALGVLSDERDAVDLRVLRNIAMSWGITLPVSALGTVVTYSLTRRFLP
eukprot:CAMPEP_0185836590 /NCGR_PEP_ID=MMETSP1353-20130828/9993_1 /TAXON_ID=1077150 /ORGANISM="Erythrolobus australicus, Strain CCMP3124" /LENGTH=480 /DNA_ID=CAMNT_0028535399 /DNA_START=194 /DNA_END=1637 /DNA_ORIENTATION=-